MHVGHDAVVDLEGPGDAFDHRDYSRTLQIAVSADDPPKTIGLFGPWGVGKTTILFNLKGRLEVGRRSAGDPAAGGGPRADKLAFVLFDAWRYEGDALRRHFLRDIAASLKRARVLRPDYAPDERLADLEVDVQYTAFDLRRPSAAQIVAALGPALVVGALVWVLLGSAQVRHSLLGADVDRRNQVAIVSAIIAVLVGMLGGVLEPIPKITSTRRIEDPDRFSALFEELLAALTVSRVVIAVDNLDRCSPDRGAEMLTTIKTYLEPAAARAPGKEAIFIVALDDQALRRHLLAHELDRSATSDPSGERAGAARYVDEYLRKFFEATVRIQGLLPEDMRLYIQTQLGPFVEAHGVPANAARKLLAILTAGLRRNPRRVKQFLNNLDLRLRLIEQRESLEERDAPVLAESLRHEVAMIATFALVEEEWPAHFDELLARPHLWRLWLATARLPPDETGRQPFWKTDPQRPDDQLREEWQTLPAFLRATNEQSPQQLRAFLFLKQAPDEVQLPGLSAFRDAARAGDRDEVAAILAENPTNAAEFASCLADVFAEELRGGHTDAARSVLDVALVSEGVLSAKDEMRRLLRLALADEGFRGELSRVPAGQLIAFAEDLRSEELLAEAVRSIASSLASAIDVELISVLPAIAPHVGLLADEERDVLRSVLESPAHEIEHRVLAPLADVDPSLVPKASIDAAVEVVRSAVPGSWGIGPEVTAILRAALRRSAVAGSVAEAVLPTLLLLVIEVRSDDEFLGAIHAVEEMLDGVHVSDGALAARSLLYRLNLPILAALEPPRRIAVTAWLTRALLRLGESRRTHIGELAGLVSALPETFPQWVLAVVADLPDDVRQRVSEIGQAVEWASPDNFVAYIEADLALSGKDRGDRLSHWVFVLGTSGDPRALHRLLDRYAGELDASSDLLTAAVATSQVLPREERPDWLALILEYSSDLDVAALRSLVALLTSQIDSPDPWTADLTIRLLDSLNGRPLGGRDLLAAAIAKVESTALGPDDSGRAAGDEDDLRAKVQRRQQDQGLIGILDALSTSKYVSEFGGRLVPVVAGWLSARPDQTAQLSAVAGQLGLTLSPDDRRTLASALLRTEAELPAIETDRREMLVRAALEVDETSARLRLLDLRRSRKIGDTEVAERFGGES